MSGLRRCLFGGTFDPPHAGHLMIAEVAREQLAVDRIDFIPTGTPPHKMRVEVSAAHERLALVTEAVANFPAFYVSGIETERPGPSYSIDTVKAYQIRYPDDTLFFLVGADMLADLANWQHVDELLRIVEIVAAPRPGIESSEAVSKLQAFFPDASPVCLDMPMLDISSSWIRERLKNGLRVDPLVPDRVLQRIAEQGMYRS